MDQEEKVTLNEIKAMVSRNDEMLKKLVRYNKIAIWSRALYWVFLILLTLGAFALLKPVLETLGSVYGVNNNQDILKVFSNPGAIEEFRNQFQ